MCVSFNRGASTHYKEIDIGLILSTLCHPKIHVHGTPLHQWVIANIRVQTAGVRGVSHQLAKRTQNSVRLETPEKNMFFTSTDSVAVLFSSLSIPPVSFNPSHCTTLPVFITCSLLEIRLNSHITSTAVKMISLPTSNLSELSNKAITCIASVTRGLYSSTGTTYLSALGEQIQNIVLQDSLLWKKPDPRSAATLNTRPH